MRDRQEEPLTEESFAELYTRFRPLMLKVARRFFPRSPAEAEEIAQEAFARAWKHRRKYQPGKNAFRNWLWMITQRAALTYLVARSSRKREVAFSVLPEFSPELVADSALLPDDLVMRQQLLACLEQVLGELPPEEYWLLFLRHGEGLSFYKLARIFRVRRYAITRRHRVVLDAVTRQML